MFEDVGGGGGGGRTQAGGGKSQSTPPPLPLYASLMCVFIFRGQSPDASFNLENHIGWSPLHTCIIGTYI